MKLLNFAIRMFSHIFILNIIVSVKHLYAAIPGNAAGNNVGSPSIAPPPATGNNPATVGNPMPGNSANNLNAGNVGNGPTNPNGNGGNLPNTSGVNNPINSPAAALNNGGAMQTTTPGSNIGGVANSNNAIGSSLPPIGMNGNRINNGPTTKPGLNNNGKE